LAAQLIAQRGIEAATTRRVIGRSARRSAGSRLGGDGQGSVDAKHAHLIGLGAFADPSPTFAAIELFLREEADGRHAHARIDVTNASGAPIEGAIVFASFRGADNEDIEGITDEEGVASFKSSALPLGAEIVSLQVNAVVLKQHGHRVERAMGALRIDSCSMLRVMRFGEEVASEQGTLAGSGIGTTPSSPLSVVNPTVDSTSTTLMNFSWLLSSAPVAVAVDDDWWQANFDSSLSMQVVNTGNSGRLVFDSSAFARPVTISSEHCVDLVVHTFGSGLDPITSPPLRADETLESEATLINAVLRSAWVATLRGGALENWRPESGLSEAKYSHLQTVARTFARFSREPLSTPVTDLSRVMELLGQGGQ
jgi:hypothetical protein